MSQELLKSEIEYYELRSYEFDPLEGSQIIEGDFPQEDNEKKMAIRKLNATLCTLLFILIAVTTVSYYFATANEMTLNTLSRQTTVFNDENVELQNKLDNLKSFNNVDLSVQKNNMLTKAKQVIEVPSIDAASTTDKKIDSEKPFNWAIGY